MEQNDRHLECNCTRLRCRKIQPVPNRRWKKSTEIRSTGSHETYCPIGYLSFAEEVALEPFSLLQSDHASHLQCLVSSLRSTRQSFAGSSYFVQVFCRAYHCVCIDRIRFKVADQFVFEYSFIWLEEEMGWLLLLLHLCLFSVDQSSVAFLSLSRVRQCKVFTSHLCESASVFI